jgi:DNA-binding CsgD family transcriptional regulator
LWIGTEGGGLNRLNTATGEFTRYNNDPSNRNSLISNRVYAIHEDKRGNLWLGTSGGLDKFERAHQLFEHFAEDDGLASNYVVRLLEDTHGRIWIVTYARGISLLDRLTRTFRNFASGYILKPSTSEEILRSIRDVVAGGVSISPPIARRAMVMFKEKLSPRDEESALTRREKEVLEHVAKGRTKKQIADQLFVSYHTVDTHLKNIHAKLNAHNRAEVVARVSRWSFGAAKA